MKIENTIFGQDHKSRMADDGQCTCTSTNLDCLLDDAEYYSDPTDFDPDIRSLCLSAQRIVKRLKHKENVNR